MVGWVLSNIIQFELNSPLNYIHTVVHCMQTKYFPGISEQLMCHNIPGKGNGTLLILRATIQESR